MKKWWVLLGVLLILSGCSASEENAVAKEPETELVSTESAGEYYLNQTHPAIVDIWDEFDYLLDTYTETISGSDYDPEYALTVFSAMITDYEELSAVVDELPVAGLDEDQAHLDKFKESAKLANDLRIQYAETLIQGLGERGIAKESMDEAMEYLELSGTASVESMEHIVNYEEEKGF